MPPALALRLGPGGWGGGGAWPPVAGRGGGMGQASVDGITPLPGCDIFRQIGGCVTAKILPLNLVTRLDMPAEKVLAAIPELEGVVIAGFTKDGEEWFASSYADGGTALWLLERCKTRLLNPPGGI